MAFGDVIGKLIAERKADPNGVSGIIDDVDACDFRFFAAVQRKAWHGKRRAGVDKDRAIALVEPFGLLPYSARSGLAAFRAFKKHPHRIGCLTGGGGLVHFVAPFGRAKVRQARSGHQQMGVVIMIDGRKQGDGGQV